MKLQIILILTLIGASNSARILGIFPTPSISHQVGFHAMMKDLATRGHQLTILTTDLMKINNPNVTQIDLSASYVTSREKFNFVEITETRKTELDILDIVYDLALACIEEQLQNPEVAKLISGSNTRKFDLVIFEHSTYYPYLAFAELYDVPAIGVTSMDTWTLVHEMMGNDANPMIHPEFFFPYPHAQLTFLERWESLKYYLKSKFIVEPKQVIMYENIVKKYFPTVNPSIEKLKKRVQLLMINTSPAMGFIRPIVPNTIQLGFMHIEPPKTLPNGELKNFLDNSKNGVIYMSLGSNVQSKDLNPDTLEIFLSVFGSLSYDVLWKFEADNLPYKPNNVMISKWLPQSDLLAHPAIKLFITQGGQQSIEEAIDRTVPMIVIPFLADQMTNAKKLEVRGVGVSLDLHSLSSMGLKSAVIKMLQPTYKENVKTLRNLVYDQPMSSRERAVWWIEYVIRHKGASHLEYPGTKVLFYQKMWLDFIGIAVIAAVLLAVVLIKMFKLIIRSCNRFKTKTD